MLVAVAEATKGERLALGNCEEKNYRTIVAAALGNGHLVVGLTPDRRQPRQAAQHPDERDGHATRPRAHGPQHRRAGLRPGVHLLGDGASAPGRPHGRRHDAAAHDLHRRRGGLAPEGGARRRGRARGWGDFGTARRAVGRRSPRPRCCRPAPTCSSCAIPRPWPPSQQTIAELDEGGLRWRSPDCEIYKLLPKTNCKECGFPTCLAFAMKLAAEGHRARQVPLRERREQGGAGRGVGAAHPPRDRGRGRAGLRGRQRDRALPPREDVLPPARPAGARHRRRRRRRRRRPRRPGGRVRRGARRHAAGARRRRHRAHGRRRRGAGRGHGRGARRRPGPAARCCIAADTTALAAAAAEAAGERPLLCGATADDWQAMAAVAAEHGCPLVVRAGDLDRARRADRAGQGRRRRGPRPGRRRRRPGRRRWRRPPSCAAWPSRRARGRSATRSCASPRGTPGRADGGRGAGHLQVRRRDRAGRLRPRRRLHAAHPAPEHLHRPAEADPGGAQALPDRRPHRRQPAC